MKILALLLGAVLALALLPGMAQASEPVPTWAVRTSSVKAAPAVIVDTAPSNEPLNVVITRRTATGPSFETVPVASQKAAEKVVDRAQDEASTIAVSMAQPVHMTASKADPLRRSQWAVDRLRVSTAWKSSVGQGVTVAVVDTGVLATHADLTGKVRTGRDFVDDDNNATDRNGHGTHVAGIIAAVANNGKGIAGMTRATSILPVRVLDQNGEGDSAGLAAGIRWAANNGANVINLSLALVSTADDPAVTAALRYARSRNILVVAAAGNAPCPGFLSGQKVFPANEPGVLGVGSINRNLAVSAFSCSGPWVDLVAPGGGIVSTMIGTPGGGMECARGSATNNYCTLSGTSMATPYVAGSAALAIAAIGPSWKVSAVEGLLQSTATDLGAAGPDTTYGAGLINPVLMLSRISTRLSLKTPTGATVAGNSQAFSGRLLYANNTPVVGARVTLSLIKHGKVETHAVTTNSTGSFSRTIRLIRNTDVNVKFAGTASVGRSSGKTVYRRVVPKWKVSHTSSRATVWNYSRYGQTIKLQKRVGKKWVTKKSSKVKSAKWTAKAGKGTWRIYSSANSSLAARTSPAWKN